MTVRELMERIKVLDGGGYGILEVYYDDDKPIKDIYVTGDNIWEEDMRMYVNMDNED